MISQLAHVSLTHSPESQTVWLREAGSCQYEAYIDPWQGHRCRFSFLSSPHRLPRQIHLQLNANSCLPNLLLM